MTIGPEPMTRMRWRSDLRGINHHVELTKTSRQAPGGQARKREPSRLPLFTSMKRRSRDLLSSRRPLDLAGVEAAGADLHLLDLPIELDAGDLKVRPPGAAGLVFWVVRVVGPCGAPVGHRTGGPVYGAVVVSPPPPRAPL